jgi:tetratricopeptide (TPR) repeat protein
MPEVTVAYLHYTRGSEEKKKGKFREALGHYATSVQCSEADKNPRGVAFAAFEAGVAASELGEHQLAADWYARCVQQAEHLLDKPGFLASAFRQMGNSLVALHDYPKAKQAFLAALDKQKVAGDNTDLLASSIIKLIRVAVASQDEALVAYGKAELSALIPASDIELLLDNIHKGTQ